MARVSSGSESESEQQTRPQKANSPEDARLFGECPPKLEPCPAAG